MRQFSRDNLAGLLSEQQAPCISLYLPTHRRHPENVQDPLVYRNLLDELQGMLEQRYAKREMPECMPPLQALLDDADFWNHRTEGTVILWSPQRFEIFDLQRSVEPFVSVADSFYVKPLLRILQSSDRYQVLSLSRRHIHLFEGNRDALDSVDVEHLPASLRAALGRGPGDDEDADLERFFRSLDQAIQEHHGGLPLILAGLPEHHTAFRAVSHNPLLLESDGIRVNADTLDADALRTQAWDIVLPYYLKRLDGLVEQFNLERSRGLGSDQLNEVAAAAVQGRVAVLLVEADRKVPGQLNAQDGTIASSSEAAAGMSDVLDDVAEEVLRKKGEVIIVPAERMPSRSGLAAIYRY